VTLVGKWSPSVPVLKLTWWVASVPVQAIWAPVNPGPAMLVSGRVTLAVSLTAASTAGERDAARAGDAGAAAATPMTTMSTTRNSVTRTLVGVGAVRFWAMLATPLRALCILLVKRARSIGASSNSWTVLQAACKRYSHAGATVRPRLRRHGQHSPRHHPRARPDQLQPSAMIRFLRTSSSRSATSSGAPAARCLSSLALSGELDDLIGSAAVL